MYPKNTPLSAAQTKRTCTTKVSAHQPHRQRNILVIGAGIIGLSTAYTLAARNHRVTLIEPLPGPGLGTSHANSGQLSTSLAAPWAAPGLLRNAWKWARQQYPPLIIRRRPDGAMLRFLWHMYRESNRPAYQRNRHHMLTLAHYSRQCLETLQQQLQLSDEHNFKGCLLLLRNRQQLRFAQQQSQWLQGIGLSCPVITAAEISALEPNLATNNALLGALRLPHDGTGDCYRFCLTLAQHCRNMGVELRFGETVHQLHRSGDQITAATSSSERLQRDIYIVCAGVDSPQLLQPLGIRLPIYPVKGYSLSVRTSKDCGPHSTVLDDSSKIGITRLGPQIRIAGTAELAGFDRTMPAQRFSGLQQVAEELFPAIPKADLAAATRWAGLRPMTADSRPLIGPVTGCRNLYLNTGHGAYGWTMACGSAELLAAILEDRPQPIDPRPFAWPRPIY